MTEEGILSTFTSHAFLRGLDYRHLMLLASWAKPFTLAPGEFLAREGEPANAFYLIQLGRANIGIHTPDRAVPVQAVGPGDVVGWSWFVPPHVWHFDCWATDTVRGIAFDGEWLRAKCEDDHELGYYLLKQLLAVIAGRLAATRRQLLRLSQPSQVGGPGATLS